MTNKFIYKNMSEDGTHHRPEQMLIAGMLKSVFKYNSKTIIKTEYEVIDLKQVEDIPPKRCVPDIVVISVEMLRNPKTDPRKYSPIAIRVMGEKHEKPTQMRKDRDQKLLLEGNGWMVIDVWHHEFPEFWQPHRYTLGELEDALSKAMGWMPREP